MNLSKHCRLCENRLINFENIIGVGFLTLSLAFGSINKYKQNIVIARRKKDALDILIETYNLEYKINFKIEIVHGIDKIKTEINFKKKNKKSV
jgi:hypothetical protein